MIFIYSTFPNRNEAESAGKNLIKKRLTACVNLFSIRSVYFWKGKIREGKETAVIIKARKENFKKIEKFILERHSYDTPCILEIPLGRVNKKYEYFTRSYNNF